MFADHADRVDAGVGDDPGGLYELVAGGVEGGAEAGPVRGDAGAAVGGVDHGGCATPGGRHHRACALSAQEVLELPTGFLLSGASAAERPMRVILSAITAASSPRSPMINIW